MNSNYASSFAENLATVYRENRPEGLPESIQIVHEGSSDERQRPCAIFSSSGEEWLHPKLQNAEITLELQIRKGDDGAADAKAWMDKLKSAMLQLALAAVPEGCDLRYLMVGADGKVEEETGWVYSALWRVRFQQRG
ncbi:MAG: hypothetical protein QM680_06545 [Luteolibacter sp.]